MSEYSIHQLEFLALITVNISGSVHYGGMSALHTAVTAVRSNQPEQEMELRRLALGALEKQLSIAKCVVPKGK